MGWMLLAVATLLVAVVVLIGAVRAKGAAFNNWVGWATVWGLVVAAVGVVLVVWDKIAGGSRRPALSTAQAEDELAKLVLDQAQVTRSQLLGTDEPGDDAANVRFVKTSCRFREVGGSSTGDLASVLEYYRSLSPGRLVLLGEPGAGKTVLALELVVRLLEQREQDGRNPVPVLISAAACDTSRAWGEWLTEHLAQRFNMSVAAVAELVRDRRIVPVVDGLDEMDLPGRPERARSLVGALNSYMRGRERAAVVATCRSVEYDALGAGLARATHIEIVPMSGQEAVDYLTVQFRDEQESQEWQPLLAELAAHPDGLLASQLSTPWRLTLALTVFRAGGQPADLLPDASVNPADTEAVAGYLRGVDALLLDRYVVSAMRLHDPGRRYADRPVRTWLTALAAGLARQAHSGQSGTDIVLAHWWRFTGPWAARAVHVTLAAIPGIIAVAVAAITKNNELRVIGSAAVVTALAAALPPSPKRSRFRQLTTQAGMKRAAIGFVGVLTFWLVAGVVLGLVSGSKSTSVAGPVLLGLFIGVPMGLVAGLAVGLIDSSPQAVRPRDVIHADGFFGLAAGLAAGFAAGLPFGLVAWRQEHRLAAALQVVLEVTLVLGLTVVISIGASSWVRYHIAVVCAALRGNGPLRFGALLDWARDAGLLRESGIAYQFRHRQLQDRLAPPEGGSPAPAPVRRAAFAGTVIALLAGIAGLASQVLEHSSYESDPIFSFILGLYAMPTVVAVIALMKRDRPVIIAFLLGLWWLAVSWIASDVVTVTQLSSATGNYLAGFLVEYASDALGAIAAIFLVVSLNPVAAARRAPRIGVFTVVLLGAAGFSQIAASIFWGNEYRQIAAEDTSASLSYSLEYSILGIAGVFVVLAVTWYALSIRARALGGALVLGWVSTAAFFPVIQMSNLTLDSAGEHLSDVLECALLATVVILTIRYVRRAPGLDRNVAADTGTVGSFPTTV
jgi:hypothetical protein